MKKIIVISSLLVLFMFLVSCAPQITDEELEAELAKLTPEEREALVKDLENEKGAFAGKAVANRYGAKLVAVPKAKIIEVARKLPTGIKCTDTDGSMDGQYFYPDNEFVKGTAKGPRLINATNDVVVAPGSMVVVSTEDITASDSCLLSLYITGKMGRQKYDMPLDKYGVNNCSDYKPGDKWPFFVNSVNDDVLKIKEWNIKSIGKCFVNEQRCSIYSDVSVNGVKWEQYPVVIDNDIDCEFGCSNGACLPAPANLVQTK